MEKLLLHTYNLFLSLRECPLIVQFCSIWNPPLDFLIVFISCISTPFQLLSQTPERHHIDKTSHAHKQKRASTHTHKPPTSPHKGINEHIHTHTYNQTHNLQTQLHNFSLARTPQIHPNKQTHNHNLPLKHTKTLLRNRSSIHTHKHIETHSQPHKLI